MYFILPIVFVNFANIKQELLRYVQQTLPFRSFVFCMARYMTCILLQISRRIRQWKSLKIGQHVSDECM